MTAAPVTVPLRALDTDVDVVVRGDDPPALADAVRDRWHLCLRPEGADPSVSDPVVVEVGPGVSGQDTDGVQTRLTHAVTGAVIRAQSGRLLMLHAAALADRRTGATLVAVAPGGTGKSTLCATLGAGRGYLTDETVGVRRDGTVAAYPKPVSMRQGQRRGVKDELPPRQLGLEGSPVEPWVAGIVLLRRDPEHRGPVRLEQLGTVEALAALAPESSAFMVTERPLTWLAALLESTGGGRRVTYADTADLEPLVADVLSRERP